MGLDVHQGDYYATGNLSAGSMTVPPGTITDAMVQPVAGIAASKVVHQNPGAVSGVQLAGPTTTVATVTQTLGMAQAPGTLQALGAWIEVAAIGAATVTVDLQKSTAGGAYATVLTAPLSISSATVVRTLVAAAIATPAYVAGDIFRLVVTATAGGGTLPQGLTVKAVTQEKAQ